MSLPVVMSGRASIPSLDALTSAVSSGLRLMVFTCASCTRFVQTFFPVVGFCTSLVLPPQVIARAKGKRAERLDEAYVVEPLGRHPTPKRAPQIESRTMGWGFQRVQRPQMRVLALPLSQELPSAINRHGVPNTLAVSLPPPVGKDVTLKSRYSPDLFEDLVRPS